MRAVGINPMQRFSALARWVATVIFIPILIGVGTCVVANFTKQQPRETANVVLKFLLDLAGQTWLRGAALALGCFVAGLWLDWLLCKLDDTMLTRERRLAPKCSVTSLDEMIKDYLRHVGTMLRDGNFREAKQYAKRSKADFDKIA
jgi:hypothetical protein